VSVAIPSRNRNRSGGAGGGDNAVANRVRYDPKRASAFYDEYGEEEWTRFEQIRMGAANLDVHAHYLRRFVQPGDHVLDVGAGPGRFTIELARIGAEVVVADVSPGQLELNRQKVAEAGAEDGVRDRVVADVTDLSAFDDASFDAVVCYGGPLSYVLDQADRAVAELVRVARPGGHVLVSAMSLVGALSHYTDIVLDLANRDSAAKMEEIVRTGLLPEEPDYGHLPMRLFRWRELHELLSRHGDVVAGAAAGLLRPSEHPSAPDLRELLVRLELDLGAEPGAVDGGEHLLAVLRKP
jgi:ubiquinone/menaquinone biosynthesis C-methylase UbiE